MPPQRNSCNGVHAEIDKRPPLTCPGAWAGDGDITLQLYERDSWPFARGQEDVRKQLNIFDRAVEQPGPQLLDAARLHSAGPGAV